MLDHPRLEKWLLPLAIAAYVLIYFLFYPPIYAYRDEANYLSMAYSLKQWHLFVPVPDVPAQAFIQAGDKVIPLYPLTNSIFLIPFLAAGWKAVFL
jgi:hypothetical protein